MDHFEAGQWADFVRGLGRHSERAAMEEHLNSGCRKCNQTVRVLSKVAAIAGAEAAYQVPEHLVRSARAMYALKQPGKLGIFPRVVGRLIYDSFQGPLPAGVRTRQHLARHVLYEAGNYSLDLRLEPERGKSMVTMVGQVADQQKPDKPLADLPVFLLCGKEIVARAFSNSFGEFQVEYQPKRRLRLCIQASKDLHNRVEVPLDRFHGQAVVRGNFPRVRRRKDGHEQAHRTPAALTADRTGRRKR